MSREGDRQRCRSLMICIANMLKYLRLGVLDKKFVLKISHGNDTFDIQYCAIYIKDMQDSTL